MKLNFVAGLVAPHFYRLDKYLNRHVIMTQEFLVFFQFVNGFVV